MEEMQKPQQEITCDMCSVKPAEYYGKTNLENWAYMCENCFKFYGVGLGFGKGQKIKEDIKSC